jgi:hypothetical protein
MILGRLVTYTREAVHPQKAWLDRAGSRVYNRDSLPIHGGREREQGKDKSMIKIWKMTAVVATGVAVMLTTSCVRPPAPAPAPAAPAANDNGRFQVVVSSQGTQGAVLFLIDTRDGATWIYRPPIGPAINGYWSDIPRLTYPPELWQRAIQMLMQPPQSNAAPAGAATTPPPAQ